VTIRQTRSVPIPSLWSATVTPAIPHVSKPKAVFIHSQ